MEVSVESCYSRMEKSYSILIYAVLNLAAVTVILSLPAVSRGIESSEAGNVDQADFFESTARAFQPIGLLRTLDGEYISQWKKESPEHSCPDTVKVNGTVTLEGYRPVDDEEITKVEAQNIVEDNQPCSGGILISIPSSFAMSEQGQELLEESYGIADRLKQNQNAIFDWTHFHGSRVGFEVHPRNSTSTRICGSKRYDSSTLWYSIEAGSSDGIVLGSSANRTRITLKTGTKSLLVS